jgi:hypothetical protein
MKTTKKKENLLFNNFIRAHETNVDYVKRILHSFVDNRLLVDLVEIDKKSNKINK